MRLKCKKCGDKIFKIIDGEAFCRKGHLFGSVTPAKTKTE